MNVTEDKYPIIPMDKETYMARFKTLTGSEAPADVSPDDSFLVPHILSDRSKFNLSICAIMLYSLKYVEDMIKDEVDKQVDALEELKDKYSEIIDLKKESLQASKDEADYQDEVADKVKEMAKLQEKINALALDDSRSSVAKRKELEEQLADAQKELSQT